MYMYVYIQMYVCMYVYIYIYIYVIEHLRTVLEAPVPEEFSTDEQLYMYWACLPTSSDCRPTSVGR